MAVLSVGLRPTKATICLLLMEKSLGGGAKRTAESLFVEGLTGKKPEEHERQKLSNRKSLIDFVKKQTGIDLEKYIEPRAGHPRTGLGVHLDDIPRNGRRQVTDVLNSYGRKIRISDNGGFGDFIYFEK